MGFRHESLKVKAKRSKADGKIYDEQLYGMLKKEYSPK